ncbi:MAG: hypothetical protein LBL84_03430, partial [Candidatus Nomurabacteria bacterium]|nr:hypothetical protein [Candidatus Nomurabacteria bacterium]
MKNLAKPKPTKRRTASLAVALAVLAASVGIAPPAHAADPATAVQSAQQQFVLTLTDHRGEATASQQFTINLTSIIIR